MEELNEQLKKVQNDMDGKLERLYDSIDEKFKHLSRTSDAKFEQYFTTMQDNQKKFELKLATAKLEEEANGQH